MRRRVEGLEVVFAPEAYVAPRQSFVSFSVRPFLLSVTVTNLTYVTYDHATLSCLVLSQPCPVLY